MMQLRRSSCLQIYLFPNFARSAIQCNSMQKNIYILFTFSLISPIPLSAGCCLLLSTSRPNWHGLC